MKLFKVDIYVALTILLFAILIGVQSKFSIIGSYGFLFAGLVFLGFAGNMFYNKNLVTANPNEWLLIIKDGEMI